MTELKAKTAKGYRRNLSMLIFREMKKGATVVVLGPPNVADPEPTNDIRSYALAARQVSEQYGGEFVDMAEVLRASRERVLTLQHHRAGGLHD